jgi:hypothetical protein
MRVVHANTLPDRKQVGGLVAPAETVGIGARWRKRDRQNSVARQYRFLYFRGHGPIPWLRKNNFPTQNKQPTRWH